MFFQHYTPQIIEPFLSKREGETKLGEKIQFVNSITALKSHPAKYVLIGIPEDFGVRANHGIGGTQTAWKAFLSKFLNIQENQYQTGENFILLGAFDFTKEYETNLTEIDALRNLVSQIDQEVTSLLLSIFQAGKTPIIIGGGHNNAYSNLKAASLAFKAPINCINLDAHADFRTLEGRHSGNGFSYAKKEGFLANYYMIGLHESYNSQTLLDNISINLETDYTTFEDIKIYETISLKESFTKALHFTKGNPIGLELDLDAIQNVLSSAQTPNGFSTTEARQFIHYFKQHSNPLYLHICEGVSNINNGITDTNTGKLISYLVRDFIKLDLK